MFFLALGNQVELPFNHRATMQKGRGRITKVDGMHGHRLIKLSVRVYLVD
jgi:hypothetical protein